jgi:hypothetical protein
MVYKDGYDMKFKISKNHFYFWAKLPSSIWKRTLLEQPHLAAHSAGAAYEENGAPRSSSSGPVFPATLEVSSDILP